MPAYIRERDLKLTERNPKGGKTFQVLYRRGGRSTVKAAGTFKTLREARIRRDLVAGWIAQGLDPKAQLELLLTEGTTALTLAEWVPKYEASRADWAFTTSTTVQSSLKRILASDLARMRVDQITFVDVGELVSEWMEDLKPSTLRKYMVQLRLVFDYAGIEPNPARDKRVRLPKAVRTEIVPPTADHFSRMLNAMPRKVRLAVVVTEQTGMRIGETVSLEWGDVDETTSQFRLRSEITKTRKSRWVPVPEWLMEIVAAQVPREDRSPQRKVFAGITARVVSGAMERACKHSGIPIYSPHDLRHRRISLWHRQAVPMKELSERVGHARASMTLDIYSHTMDASEVDPMTLSAVLVLS